MFLTYKATDKENKLSMLGKIFNSMPVKVL